MAASFSWPRYHEHHNKWVASGVTSCFPSYTCKCGEWENWLPTNKFEPLLSGKGVIVAHDPNEIHSLPPQEWLKQQIWRCSCGSTIAKLCFGEDSHWTKEDDKKSGRKVLGEH
jgi:hypothetical protein